MHAYICVCNTYYSTHLLNSIPKKKANALY